MDKSLLVLQLAFLPCEITMFASCCEVEAQQLVVEEGRTWFNSSVQRMVRDYQWNPAHLFLRRIALSKGVAFRRMFHFVEVML